MTDELEQTAKPLHRSRWRGFRIWLLPLAAIAILGLVQLKLRQPREHATADDVRDASRQQPAPLFTLYDQNSRPFKLSRYLGRHKIVIVFFDPQRGASGDPQLQLLRESYEQFVSLGVKVIAVSQATPWANRNSFKTDGEIPFHVVSDADLTAHRQWDCLTGDPPQVRPTIFVLDRAGVIRWSRPTNPMPRSVSEIIGALKRIP